MARAAHLVAPAAATPAPAGRWRVGRSILVALAGLALAALLDAEALEDTASSQPFGWRRDVAVAAVEPVLDVSRALHLTAVRGWLEDAFDRPSTRPDPAPITSTTSSTTSSSSSTSTSSTTGGSSSSTTTTTTTAPPAHRTPTADAPLRLLVAGDSMTESAGPALLDAAASTGVIRAHHELRYSSGITRPDYFDWPAHLATFVAEQDAEAVVLWVGANDAQGIQTANGPASFGSDAWIAEYRARVGALMDQLTADDRLVYWLGEPIMRDGGYDGRMALITRIYREEAGRRPGVRFIDTRPLFTDANGSYNAYLPDADGQPALVRRDDGIHLTPAGADRLAPLVLAAIRADWGI